MELALWILVGLTSINTIILYAIFRTTDDTERNTRHL